MPKAFAWILAAVTVLVLALFGLAIGVALTTQDRPSGALDTDLEGVTVSAETQPKPEPEPPASRPEIVVAGGRSVAIRSGRSRAPTATLGLPARKFTWARGLGTLHRVPARLLRGRRSTSTALPATTFAIDAETGQGPMDARASEERSPRALRSTGPRSSSLAGRNGHALCRAPGSPSLAGSDGGQGRVLARSSSTGWRTSARTTAACSPCGRDRARPLGVPDGRSHQREPVGLRRPGVRHDVRGLVRLPRPRGRARSSGRRTSSAMRSATRASTRARPRTASGSTPSRARGRSSRSTPRAEGSSGRPASAASATRLPRSPTAASSRAASTADCAPSARRAATSSGAPKSDGRILGAPVVIGPYVFFSTLEKRTYALRVSDGAIAGGCRWAGTRRASRPSGRTSSR